VEPGGTGRHGAQIGTGPGELAQVGFGLVDHQMALDHAGAASSAAANVAVKAVAARDRPDAHVPAFRQLQRVPRTTSFPSGHAASAAAFATGVALEKPSLRAGCWSTAAPQRDRSDASRLVWLAPLAGNAVEGLARG
jgi:membrane-associated phospholipid phosphatase